MDDSLLINKVRQNIETSINRQATVNNFITTATNWDLESLQNILLAYIINKINFISIPVNNIRHKIASKFTTYCNFLGRI